MKVQFSYRVDESLLKQIRKNAIDWDTNVSDTITFYLLMGMSLYDLSKESTDKTISDVLKEYDKKYKNYTKGL